MATFWPGLYLLKLSVPLGTVGVRCDLFRPPVCSCSIPGECETTEDNVLEVSTFTFWEYGITVLVRFVPDSLGNPHRGRMLSGLWRLHRLHQLHLFWREEPTEVSWVGKKDYTRDEINSRFVCFLLSSCDDISTNCEDCHAGVPQCQVSVVNYLSSSW